MKFVCFYPVESRKITSYRPINVSVQSSVAYWHLNFLLTASIHFGWMISSTLEHRGGIHVITYSLDLYVPLRNIRWRFFVREHAGHRARSFDRCTYAWRSSLSRFGTCLKLHLTDRKRTLRTIRQYSLKFRHWWGIVKNFRCNQEAHISHFSSTENFWSI